MKNFNNFMKNPCVFLGYGVQGKPIGIINEINFDEENVNVKGTLVELLNLNKYKLSYSYIRQMDEMDEVVAMNLIETDEKSNIKFESCETSELDATIFDRKEEVLTEDENYKLVKKLLEKIPTTIEDVKLKFSATISLKED